MKSGSNDQRCHNGFPAVISIANITRKALL